MLPSDSLAVLADVSRLIVNNLNLARWKSDHLPADLRLSVELFRAVPEPWLRANIEEDERVYTLYADRAKAPVPLGVSLIDPTDPISNRRIVTPVRGTSCRHLEVSSAGQSRVEPELTLLARADLRP